jgi:cytidylate kinase
VAPLKAADDAYELDASSLTVDEVVGQVLAWYRTVSQLQ